MDANWGDDTRSKAPRRTFGSGKSTLPPSAPLSIFAPLPANSSTPAPAPKAVFSDELDGPEPAAGGAPPPSAPSLTDFSQLLRQRTALLLSEAGGCGSATRRPKLWKSRLARALKANAAAPRGGSSSVTSGGAATAASGGGGGAPPTTASSDGEDSGDDGFGRLFGVTEAGEVGAQAMRAAFRRVTMASGANVDRRATIAALRRATVLPPPLPRPPAGGAPAAAEPPPPPPLPRVSFAPGAPRASCAPEAPAALTALSVPAAPVGSLGGRALAAALPVVLSFLPVRVLLFVAPAVCPSWAPACAHEVAWRVACGVGGGGQRERLDGDGWGDASPAKKGRGAAAGKARGARGAPAAAAIAPPPSLLPAAAPSAPPLLTAWRSFLEAFPCGSFIAAGAYKSVFRVWCAPRARWEAVSVLDAAAAAGGSRSARAMLQAEIQAGCLLSQLLRTGACPHFVATYGAFLHVAAPEPHFPRLWALPRGAPPPFSPALPTLAAARARGDAAALAHFEGAAPRAPPPPAAHGQYLYTRLELCAGDAESFLRGLEGGVRAAEAAGGAALAASDEEFAALAASLLWQFAFALHVGRERLCLRHYDLKLLNWLLLPSADMLPAGARAPLRLRYAVGGDAPVTLQPSMVAKLTDFGNATVREDTLGASLKLAHWATLENAPPEFFLRGDAAVPGYATDAWALGLCVIHLLLGACPYEEAFAGCVAPPALRAALLAAWGDAAAPFAAMRKLIEIDEEDGGGEDGGSGAPCAATLADTLWRYAVLLGGVQQDGERAAVHATAPEALMRAVCGGDAPPPPPLPPAPRRAPRGKAAPAPTPPLAPAALAACRAAFAEDVARYSWAAGDAPLLVRARRRAARLPSSFGDLALSLLAWEPGARPTMLTVLRSGAFQALRGAPDEPPPHFEYEVDGLVDV